MARWLRVTADDFGLTPGVTDGILEAYDKGIVTHTSVMAGGLDFSRAITLAAKTPGLGVGIHLTSTWGPPQLPLHEVPNLVGTGNRFLPLRTVLLRGLLGRLDLLALAKEWRAQIKKVAQAGITPTHIDSHHHVHLLPGCLQVAAQLAREFNIPWIRRPAERSAEISLLLRGSVKGIALGALCMRPWPSRTSDQFRGLAIQGRHDFAAALKGTIENLPEGTTELMVHPGKPDALLKQEDSFVEQRAKELEAICDPMMKQVLSESGVILDRVS